MLIIVVINTPALQKISYHYEIIHLIVDKFFKVCFLQIALLTRVLVESLDNSDHAALQV